MIEHEQCYWGGETADKSCDVCGMPAKKTKVSNIDGTKVRLCHNHQGMSTTEARAVIGTWEEVFQRNEAREYNLTEFFTAVGKYASTTWYTVIADEVTPHPFRSLILTPSNPGKRPSEMGYFDDPGEASQETKASYGRDSVYVTPVEFAALVEARKH